MRILVSLAVLFSAAAGAAAAAEGALEGSVRTDDGLALPHVAVTVEGDAQDGLVPAKGKLSSGDALIVNPPDDLTAESRVRTAE